MSGWVDYYYEHTLTYCDGPLRTATRPDEIWVLDVVLDAIDGTELTPERHAAMGDDQWLHRASKADAERLHGELQRQVFASVSKARRVIEAWRLDDNKTRRIRAAAHVWFVSLFND